MVLPSEYKQVKYIQSTATNPGTTSSTGQCIDTGFTHTPNTKVEIDFQYLATTVQQRMFGTETTNSSYSTFVTYINGSGKWARATKDGEGNWQSTEVTADTNRHTFVLDKSTYVIYTNGSQIHSGSNAYTMTKNGQYPLTLFATKNINYSGYIEHASAKLYSCKIYDNNILVRDFVPVIRVSDNKPGLYDLVNDVFYTNAGTGEFTYEKYAEKGKFRKILLGESQIYPHKSGNYDFWYSDDNFSEYQSLVDSVGSVQFVDSGRRYRFNNAIYIGDRMAINVNGSTFSKINLDTLTVVSSKSSTVNGRMWYFGNDRVLTRDGIMDFDGNMVTSFGTTYNNITPGLPGVVWATDSNKGIYRGAVDGDNITFTKIGTVANNGNIVYCKTGAYSLWASNNGGSIGCYMNPTTKTIAVSSISASGYSSSHGIAGPDGKMYVAFSRQNWGLFYRLGTGSNAETTVGTRSSSEWLGYGSRTAHFLGNLASGAPSDYGATGSGFGSNSTFISTNGTTTFAQSNALAYDTNVYGMYGFIDENGWLYPTTSDGGNGVILKTNKTFTDFHWRNPYLWR